MTITNGTLAFESWNTASWVSGIAQGLSHLNVLYGLNKLDTQQAPLKSLLHLSIAMNIWYVLNEEQKENLTVEAILGTVESEWFGTKALCTVSLLYQLSGWVLSVVIVIKVKMGTESFSPAQCRSFPLKTLRRLFHPHLKDLSTSSSGLFLYLICGSLINSTAKRIVSFLRPFPPSPFRSACHSPETKTRVQRLRRTGRHCAYFHGSRILIQASPQSVGVLPCYHG